MKFLLALIITLLFSFLVQYFHLGPWWSVAVVCFLVGAFMSLNTLKSFSFGFFAIMVLWGIYAFYLNSLNEGMLATKVGLVFKGLSSGNLLGITALIGGIVGGLAAMSGSYARQLVKT